MLDPAMDSQDLERRVLALAEARGWLDPGSRRHAPAQAAPESAAWGPRLASLLAEGRLSADEVELLAQAVLQGNTGAGSWTELRARDEDTLTSAGGRYLDLVQIGEGATARIYRAYDTRLNRRVALKFLKSGPSLDPEALLAEARAQAQVEHPNVCRIYEVGGSGDRAFLSMQLVEGPTLADLAGELGLRAKLEIVRDVAEGVHAAHRRGLVHLDLKPGNILVARSDRGDLTPLVTDFGMMRSEAEALAATCPLGTPPYSSPEQVGGKAAAVDRRSDIYSLGVLLYGLLAGALPFEAVRFADLLEAIRRDDPVPLRRRWPACPPDLEAIAARAMAKEPLARYDSAQALADDVQRYLDGLPVQARPASAARRLRLWLGRHRALAWSVAAGAGAVLATGALLGHQAWFNRRQGDWAQRFEQEVDELEGFLGRVYSQPAHPLDRELAQARARVAALEQEMASGGRAARGPGHYALGRAHALLGDAPAEDHFKAAWEEGFRTAPLRWERARSLIQRYRALQDQVPRDAAGRDALMTYFQRAYLEPAKTILAEAGTARRTRGYILVQAALLEAEGNYPELLELLRREREARPWDFQAWIDEADAVKDQAWGVAYRDGLVAAFALRAGERLPTASLGARSEILQRLEASEGLLREALRLAPSCPDAYRSMAGRWHLQAACRLADPPGDTARAGDWLAQGLRVSPADRKLLDTKANWLRLDVLMEDLARGRDPGATLAESRALRSRLDGEASMKGDEAFDRTFLATLGLETPPADWEAALAAEDRQALGLPPEEDPRWTWGLGRLPFPQAPPGRGQEAEAWIRRVLAWVEAGRLKLSAAQLRRFQAEAWLDLAEAGAGRAGPDRQALAEASRHLAGTAGGLPGLRLEVRLARMESMTGAGTPQGLEAAAARLGQALSAAPPSREGFLACLEASDAALTLAELFGRTSLIHGPVQGWLVQAEGHLPGSGAVALRRARLRVLEGRPSEALREVGEALRRRRAPGAWLLPWAAEGPQVERLALIEADLRRTLGVRPGTPPRPREPSP